MTRNDAGTANDQIDGIGWLPPPLLQIWRTAERLPGARSAALVVTRVLGVVQTVDGAVRLLKDKDVFDWTYDDNDHQPFDWEPDDEEPVTFWRGEVLERSDRTPTASTAG